MSHHHARIIYVELIHKNDVRSYYIFTFVLVLITREILAKYKNDFMIKKMILEQYREILNILFVSL
jgi:hypothetical protein